MTKYTRTKKILGLLPPVGGGIRDLKETGQESRLINYYFKEYTKVFDEIRYFSYFDETIEEYTDDPILLSRIRFFPNKTRIKGKAYSFILPIILRDEIRTCNVLRIFQITGNIPLLFLKPLGLPPIISTYGYRGTRLEYLKRKYIKSLLLFPIEHAGIHFSDHIITTTVELKEYLMQHIPETKITLIPNGVDTELFKPNSNLVAKNKNTYTILFIGRLSEQKNLFRLFEAIKAACLNIRLILVGKGHLKETLQKAAHGFEAEFIDYVPHNELPNLMRRANIFVLPSVYEGHPKVLLEAMSMGLPCVVSDCDGNRTLISDGETGLLFNPYDIQDMALKLKLALTNSELAKQLGQGARKYVEENYEIRNLIKREVELLLLLSQKSMTQKLK